MVCRHRLAACCALALALIARPSAAGTVSFAWGPLTGRGDLFAPDGSMTPVPDITSAVLTIAYDDGLFAPAHQGTVTIASGMPWTVASDVFFDLQWSIFDGSLMLQALFSNTDPGGDVSILFGGTFTGIWNFAGTPRSLSAITGYPISASIGGYGGDPPYMYGLYGPADVVPEPPGLLLAILGLVGAAAGADKVRSRIPSDRSSAGPLR